ncbi:MAG: tetratricopeptide repeat protein [Pyrinomonadaceae bacterium]
MSDLNETDICEIDQPNPEGQGVSPEIISVRISPQSYLTAVVLASFASAFLLYLEMDIAGLITLAAAWILIPSFGLNDRIQFDGKRLARTGIVPRGWAWITASRHRLRIVDIEGVETHAVRAVKRGGNVYYRYRVLIRGKGLSVAIASGGDDFRLIVKSILQNLDEDVLDTRSIELRDHLADPKDTLMRAESVRIPSAEALENSIRTVSKRVRMLPTVAASDETVDGKAEDLRSLANELRVSGHFLQALEAFRRALVLRPKDGRLLFEFARCLHSFADVRRDAKLERRALALLRLSERRADGDADLLVRLGEWYFQIGEWRRAGNVFQAALDRAGESFRTARGLAEIALREGKIAHVIHQFATATRVAGTPSLRRWSKAEAAYFSNLNSNEEYMELEISRVNMLDTVENSKKTALRITFVALPAILFGVLFEDYLIANIGWAVASVALLMWIVLIFSARTLSRRIPYELVDIDD